MKYSPEFIRFNQGIIFGEVGALIGVPLTPLIVSRFTTNAAALSTSAVIGGVVLGSAFWLIANLSQKHAQESTDSGRGAGTLAKRIAYFTPAAFLISLVTYHPVIWLVSYWLLRKGTAAPLAAITAEGLAFVLFLSAMNLYRLALYRVTAVRI